MEFQLKGGILRLLFMKWGYVIILPIIRLSNSWLSDWKCERTLPTRLQQRAGFCFRHFSWWSLSPAATAFRWTHSLQCSGWVRGLRMYMNLSCSCVNCLCVRVILKWGQWAVVWWCDMLFLCLSRKLILLLWWTTAKSLWTKRRRSKLTMGCVSPKSKWLKNRNQPALPQWGIWAEEILHTGHVSWSPL